ncbi:gliding motility-associated C-terminal domain-containing protein [Panacibacter sp. DH6]|uniref:Gliding motility-associated C-terminal domain-containing protein n=1 Tax=Panacibacter microcysteis TaxID=2793269 RepID=A0A931E6S6_9BACT|nr:gliding motility-associated C-terminal domain-containing protein [Panacibacter microcysteis]
MRKLILYIIFCCIVFNANADHITGGQIYYTLKSVSGPNYTYAVTVKMYMDCNSFREFYNPAYISVFNKKTTARVQDLMVSLTNIEVIRLTDVDECITNPPVVCHKIGYYIFDITLPASPDGYLLTTEVFFRVNNMNNLVSGYDNVGATYTAEIPGTFLLTAGPTNSSARFTGSDLVIICASHEFEYSFGSEDPDGDELTYSLCNAYRSDNFMFGVDLTPAAAPPYPSVPYDPEFSGGRPLGNNVHIDAKTGLISGIAPGPGTYVVTVCVEEKRNGKIIATQRKDLQIRVTDCSFTSATLADQYLLCDTSKTIYLENLSTSALIQSYNWRITDNGGATLFSSPDPTATYSFTDTGKYNIMLDINKNQKCADSANSTILVYPGFKPGFDYKGLCVDKQTQFIDISSSFYGTVNSWQWSFTGQVTLPETSTLQNPVYTYNSLGSKLVSLVVADSKGCTDTVYKTIEVVDKPPLNLAFKDTLICKPDTLQLVTGNTGKFFWTPANLVSNVADPNPVVMPDRTTTYYVELDIDGCKNNDSVTVNVVDHVTLTAMPDSTICSGDPTILHIVSDGLQFNWQPADKLTDASLKEPSATTNNQTLFTVTANIGRCIATDKINITTVPYPVALAGNDTIICFGTSALLHGFTDGNRLLWSPAGQLQNTASINTTALPATSTTYTLTAFYDKGCPKPGIDSVRVTVLPKINAFAGRDTTVVVNQVLQLNGSGGTTYTWVPAANLSAANIANPVARFSYASDNAYKLVVGNEAGCHDSAYIQVKVYKTRPSIFVPTGFTPNKDGKNDVLRPIIAGMQKMEIFSVYNRWGQLLFSTAVEQHGWDGTVSGNPQPTGTYVWMVKAIDYTGAPYFTKGTTTLIR